MRIVVTFRIIDLISRFEVLVCTSVFILCSLPGLLAHQPHVGGSRLALHDLRQSSALGQTDLRCFPRWEHVLRICCIDHYLRLVAIGCSRMWIDLRFIYKFYNIDAERCQHFNAGLDLSRRLNLVALQNLAFMYVM